MWALRLYNVCVSVLLMFFGEEQAENITVIKNAFEKMEYISGGYETKVLE